jgi:hypothetical protein
MAAYEIRELRVTQLLLNLKNYRFDPMGNQREAIRIMLENQGDKLVRLAADITFVGLNPSDLPIVAPSAQDSKKFVVLEGNRRLTSLKLLNQPTLASLGPTKAHKKRFVELSKEYRKNIIDKVMCVVFKNHSVADRWIELKHTGQNKGVGTVDWDAAAVARFNESRGKPSLALQAIDFMKENANLDDDLKKKIDSISTTNLNRLLGDAYVKDFLGISSRNGQLYGTLEKDEIIKGLRKIIFDLANKNIKVNDIYYQDDRKEYIEGFGRGDIPSRNKRVGTPWSFDAPSVSQSKTKNKSAGARKRSRSLSTKRKKLIPPGCILKINDSRINTIYWELKGLNVDEFANAASTLLRVFFELSVDHFIKKNQIAVHGQAKLFKKVEHVVDFMKSNNILNDEDLKPVKKSVSNPDGLFAINTFNAYVHNIHFEPIPKELKITWDRMEHFMEKLWD